MKHRLVETLLLAGLITATYGNITFSKNGSSIFELRPNGSMWYANGCKQFQVDDIEPGELSISYRTNKRLWTKSNKDVHLAGMLSQNATLPQTGLCISNGTGPLAEISTGGNLYLKNGVFIVNVEEIHFNWTTASHTTDALNIRSDGYNAISVPEFNRSTSYNASAAYLCNKNVSIKVKFSVQPTSITSLQIQGVSSEKSGGILPGTQKTTVTFSGGVSGLVTFNLTGATSATINSATDIWDWNVSDGTTMVTADRTSHKVYALYSEPQAPWVLTAGSTNNPWSRVLEYACAWANGEMASNAAIAKKITEGGYRYFPKIYNGEVTHSGATYCNLTDLLNDVTADCLDMSAVVQLFSQIVGVPDFQVRRVKGYFTYKPILPIGASEWEGGDPNGTPWGLHRVGWYNNGVYDACIQLNPNSPRIAVQENIDGSYKADLFLNGAWDLQSPESIKTIN